MTRRFTSPPDPARYHAQVWALVRQIPAGRVATYGQIAGWIPIPEGVNAQSYLAFGARWVGGAMALCPGDVPWQRVINSQGRISPRKGGGHHRQRELLLVEGVVFDDQGRVDLSQYGWSGSSLATWPAGESTVPAPTRAGDLPPEEERSSKP